MHSATGLKTDKNLELAQQSGGREKTTDQDLNVTPIALHKVDTLCGMKKSNIMIANGSTLPMNHSFQKTKNDMLKVSEKIRNQQDLLTLISI